MGCSHSVLYKTKDYKRLLEINEWFKKEFPADWRITEEDIKILSVNMNIISYFLARERGPTPKIMAQYAVASSMAFVGEYDLTWEWRLKKLRENFVVIGEVIK
jgi:hypothetical protein